MLELEKDFVLKDEEEFEIEGRKFKYKPVTSGDELRWVKEYIEVVDGKAIQNFEKKTICKLRNILEVPYSKEIIKKVINVDKEWKNLKKEERWKFLSKLNPKIFDKIIVKINDIDSSDNSEVKKN